MRPSVIQILIAIIIILGSLFYIQTYRLKNAIKDVDVYRQLSDNSVRQVKYYKLKDSTNAVDVKAVYAKASQLLDINKSLQKQLKDLNIKKSKVFGVATEVHNTSFDIPLTSDTLKDPVKSDTTTIVSNDSILFPYKDKWMDIKVYKSFSGQIRLKAEINDSITEVVHKGKKTGFFIARWFKQAPLVRTIHNENPACKTIMPMYIRISGREK